MYTLYTKWVVNSSTYNISSYWKYINEYSFQIVDIAVNFNLTIVLSSRLSYHII